MNGTNTRKVTTESECLFAIKRPLGAEYNHRIYTLNLIGTMN